MGILEDIASIDKKFAWSFLGFLLAAVFGLLSIYTEFWKEEKPKLEFEIVSNTPVLSVRERIDDLEVLYKSQDIAKTGKSLSVVIVRAINNGSTSILKSAYDNDFPIGVKVESGSLIRADISTASSLYLTRGIEIKKAGNFFTYSPVIIEPGEWFSTKILILHDARKKPKITSFGKIAGMHGGPPITLVAVTQEKGLLSRAIYGDVWVQALRVAFYFFVGCILLLAAVSTSILLDNQITRRRRKKYVKKYRKTKKSPLGKEYDFIYEGYIRDGITFVRRVCNLARDPEATQRLIAIYAQISGKVSSLPEAQYSANEELDFYGRRYGSYRDGKIAQEMLDNKFLIEKKQEWLVAPEKLEAVNLFLDYLEYMGESD